MAEVFGFILLLFTLAFWGAVVICGVGIMLGFLYGILALPFIIYRHFLKESVEKP
jgi:hypothetical protein